MSRRPLLIMIVAAVAVLLLPACGGKASGDAAAPAGPQVVELTLTELQFTPAAVKVQKGRPVELRLKNAGTAEHDFVLMGMPATDIQNAEFGHVHGGAGTIAGHVVPGQTTIVRFTPTQAGEWRFYCSVTGHRQAGMQGLITVN